MLKNKLSEYIRVASHGETILVTDGDRVVAEIGPASDDPRLAAAAAAIGIPIYPLQ